jgi:hypothetical protein
LRSPLITLHARNYAFDEGATKLDLVAEPNLIVTHRTECFPRSSGIAFGQGAPQPGLGDFSPPSGICRSN